MPGGDVKVQEDKTPLSAKPQETAAFGEAYQQAVTSGQAGRNALLDPRTQLATAQAQRDQIGRQIGILQGQLDDANQQATWNWGDIRNVQERQRLLPQQILAEQSKLSTLDASIPAWERQAAQLTKQEAVNAGITSRISDYLEKGLSVSPEEEKFIREKYEAGIAGLKSQLPGLLQNTATTRGLNQTDVPVMQSVAGPLAGGIAGLQSEAASSLISQANANRALFTGINQFQQGLDLSNRQLQAGLAGQNPAANLTGIFSNLRGQQGGSDTQRQYGAADYISMTGQGAGGVGLGLYGLGASGLLGGGTAATTGTSSSAALGAYGGSMAMGCWIAEVIYGIDAPETGVIRWWLNTHFAKQPVGRVVMALYRRYGQQVASYIQQWPWLRYVLRPVFNLALKRALVVG